MKQTVSRIKNVPPILLAVLFVVSLTATSVSAYPFYDYYGGPAWGWGAVSAVGAVPAVGAVSAVGAVPAVGAVSAVGAVPAVGAVSAVGAVPAVNAVPGFWS